MHAMEDPRAGDWEMRLRPLLPLGNAATDDSRCNIAYDVGKSDGYDAIGGRPQVRTEESTLSNLNTPDAHSNASNNETSGGVANGDAVGESADGGMPPSLCASSLEEAVIILPGMVAGQRARSHKRNIQFSADKNHEANVKNLDAHQTGDLFVVQQQQGQGESSADERKLIEDYQFVSQDPSSGDDEDEDDAPIVDKEINRQRMRRSSLVALTGGGALSLLQIHPTSILITEKKRLERKNRSKAVTELRRVHFRIPKARRSWQRLGPVDSSVSVVQFWRMVMLLPIAWEMWAFAFRLAFCDIERNERMFVYTIDIIVDVWFGIAMIGHR